MKKIVIGISLVFGVAFANPLANTNNFTGQDLNNVINSGLGALDLILKKFNELDKLSKGTLSQCLPIPDKEKEKNICSTIPDMGFEINICGKSVYKNPRSYLEDYCNFGNDKKKQGGGVIKTTENKGKEIGGGGGVYSGGKTPSKHYSKGGTGSINNIIKDTSLANTNFFKNNQEKLRIIDDVAKDTGKNISEITIDDVVTTIPKDQIAYFKERDAKVDAKTADLISYSPYNLSVAIEKEIKGLQGASAQNKARMLTQKAISALDAMQKNREAIELEKARKNDDYVYPNKEMVDLLREDNKIDAVVKIQEQITREADVIAISRIENEKRKNLLLLTEQKALIMNENFDRASARAEIEQLIK